MDDDRKLVTFEKSLGLYSVAGAICSYGDVIDFVDGEKQGIIIADTCGHVKECGDKARGFLQREIKNGWGSSRDARTEILDLGRRLMVSGHGKPYFKRGKPFSDEWWDAIEFCYAHFDEDKISLTGLRHFILRENGNLERLNSTLGPYHFEEPGDRKTIETYLGGNEVMLMSSDGLIGNTAKSLDSDARAGKISLDTKAIGDKYVNSQFAQLIGRIIEQSAEEIRDTIISELGKYFLPRTLRYDDVTFTVVKRNNQ